MRIKVSNAVFGGIGKRALRGWLALFFVALTVPAVVLVHHAYNQLRWESFHQYRVLAEEFAQRMDAKFTQLIASEEVRSFADYGFLVVAGDPAANFVQRSPLSVYPVTGSLPGTIGYFQVDSDGGLTTPLLPALDSAQTYGIPPDEFKFRVTLQSRIRDILGRNRLVQDGKSSEKKQVAAQMQSRPKDLTEGESAKSETNKAIQVESLVTAESRPSVGFQASRAPQANFDRLKENVVQDKWAKKRKIAGKLGRVEDLKLDSSYQDAMNGQALKQLEKTNRSKFMRSTRKERSVLPEADEVGTSQSTAIEAPKLSSLRIRMFESEIDPFELSLLDSGQFVLYRKVWRDGQRMIQGALLEQQLLFEGLMKSAFAQTALSRMSDLIVAYRGDVIAVFGGRKPGDYLSSADELQGALLYTMHLSAPLNDVELIFNINRLPTGAGSSVIIWAAIVMALVLCGGLWVLYRLGLRQIELARQQQDFVSAVSHELKTPLTSIRMYGEMLREGWVGDDKKKTYYDFIYFESERLSRLIANVLQLARMTRNGKQLDLKPVLVAKLMDSIQSKVVLQTERAGFELIVDCEASTAGASICLDTDQFLQVMINLVDNAVKFSAKATVKRIELSCRMERGDRVMFLVRDYGLGIPRNQMKKIFRLFYRSESELTRETVGTGIGLALVHQLATSMGGTVDVTNRQPGAEFRVSFPTAKMG